MYDELYEVWKKEKETVEIQKLPKNFYAKIAGYVKKIGEEGRMLDKQTTKARLLKIEFKSAKHMVEELIRLRYDKALKRSLAREPMPRGVLTKEEEKLYREVLPLAEAYQAFSKDILRGQLSHARSHIEKKEKPKRIILRFVQEIPEIVGPDMKTYGPFEPEDIAILPSENARTLIKQGIAVEVEAK